MLVLLILSIKVPGRERSSRLHPLGHSWCPHTLDRSPIETQVEWQIIELKAGHWTYHANIDLANIEHVNIEPANMNEGWNEPATEPGTPFTPSPPYLSWMHLKSVQNYPLFNATFWVSNSYSKLLFLTYGKKRFSSGTFTAQYWYAPQWPDQCWVVGKYKLFEPPVTGWNVEIKLEYLLLLSTSANFSKCGNLTIMNASLRNLIFKCNGHKHALCINESQTLFVAFLTHSLASLNWTLYNWNPVTECTFQHKIFTTLYM